MTRGRHVEDHRFFAWDRDILRGPRTFRPSGHGVVRECWYCWSIHLDVCPSLAHTLRALIIQREGAAP